MRWVTGEGVVILINNVFQLPPTSTPRVEIRIEDERVVFSWSNGMREEINISGDGWNSQNTGNADSFDV